MSNISDKSSSPKPLFSVKTIVIAGIVWAVLALLFFLLFSITPPGEERPKWYLIGTYIFEQVAYLFAAILCFRNWRSPQIVSGRQVWLGIGLGMLFYFLGNFLFGFWELVWKLEPDVSLGDLFFIGTYIALAWGMIQAVISRRLNLEKWQWAIVVGIAAIGIALAYWVTTLGGSAAQAAILPSSNNVALVAQASPSPAVAPPAAKPPAAKTPEVKPTATPATVTPAASPKPVAKPTVTPAATEATTSVPPWIVAIDEQLKPFATPVGLFYVVADVLLLIIATMLLLAFWGGRFSQSWRMIAAAALCLYIADMWFKWAEKQPDYQSGSLPEVFWVFSGVLFAIGAALEYDTSTSSRSRRSGARKRG
ncbi:hypothetical protein IQ264_01830 [Phormidium sp. LEGE 05292]|uniref:SPOR domain-containing protein n=1 Tax=[Phormidium] sp. LEGE 05292 TaxID=767427 RepID=UPI001882D0D7|nr:hypothetical protein [Phormidium sp. LEGE 05292]MBE9224211.1 hypothetical protein [Phormidium sp. LEGE 05292]